MRKTLLKDYITSGVKQGVTIMKTDFTANVPVSFQKIFQTFGRPFSKVTGKEISIFWKLYHLHLYLAKSSSSRTINGPLTKFLKYILKKALSLACFKIAGNKWLWSSLLLEQALTCSLGNSCSKHIFGKLPRRPPSVFNKNSAMDVLPESFQNFSEQLFFRNTNGPLFPKT